MMTCQRIEKQLSAYLEGELAAGERAEVERHLAACADCAELLGLMRETMTATDGFPEAEPSAALMARLYGIPEGKAAKAAKKRFLRTAFEWLARPALQPAYAAATGFLIVLCFVLFHPEGRGIRKAIDVQLHRGIGTVEKLYADAGGIKGEIRAVSAGVVKSFNSLGLLQGSENKK